MPQTQYIDAIFMHKMYTRLLECAMNNETTTTEALALEVGLPKGAPKNIQAAVNKYLNSITEFENDHGRPMLTSMIVQRSLKPTKAWLKSYFILYKNYNPEGAEEKAKELLSSSAKESCRELLQLEQERVVQYWTIPQI